jgi:methylase of polypeptide subunit release factors
MGKVSAVSDVRRYANVATTKSGGETYTPKKLADFVAKNICKHFDFDACEVLRLLDPAVGDGELAISLIDEVRKFYKGQIELYAFDTNSSALASARSRVSKSHPDCILNFKERDFLEFVTESIGVDENLFFIRDAQAPEFDLIIANPPYVRTQIMGADVAKRLAVTFGLSGRVDLYQAFLMAMAKVLAPAGSAGFIVSNRFMTIKGGSTLRAKLREMLRLREVWDLGDTKLFDAAVLPAVIIANGVSEQSGNEADIAFTSIYETQDSIEHVTSDPISALDLSGVVSVDDGRRFSVKSGLLDQSGGQDAVWRVSTATSNAWLETVAKHTDRTFGDLGKIRVGVKTCADKIFIRHDWEAATKGRIPELLRPLITHHGAGRFCPTTPSKARYILYPHTITEGKRAAVNLDQFPNSKAYLEANRATLQGRSYVIDAGRNWYELWVPQDPASWLLPKLVFRDISERPTFWMDLEGSVVNGDCYWMIPSDAGDTNLLWLALAVANSTFAEAFYDHRFNNKLYAGRRRFITQYVEQFPLPDPETDLSKAIIARAQALYAEKHSDRAASMENELDEMVWRSFGLREEVRR